ncbi:MAG: glycosyltransferase family 2 protein [Cyanobacteria bacterium J06621_12]
MTQSQSLISVVLIFYNASVINLEAAIKSVLAQSYSKWELLLVDDGSTNKSSNLARNYALLFPQHIRYLEHERHLNLGVSASYNQGIEKAMGQYICFLTANQTWLPHKLRHQLTLLEKHPEIGAVFGFLNHSSVNIQLNNKEQQRYWNQRLNLALSRVNQPPDLSILLLLNRIKPFSTSDILLRRQTIELTGKFDPRLNLNYALEMFLLQVCFQTAIFVDRQSSINYVQPLLGSQTENPYPEIDTYPDSESLAQRVYWFWLEKHLAADRLNNQALSQLVHHQLFSQKYSWHSRFFAYLQKSLPFLREKS